ncbi:MAG: phage/plasmid primase, P4 family [Coriobacteriia bacterium]|nr:phage/plasmid primase, P4 family [Coriobacteriia bacterium]
MDISNNTMLVTALQYAAQGLAVFPLEPNSKAPLGRLAPNGFKNATKDPELIKSWWQQEPNAGIGIACGAVSGGLFVVDIDVRDNDGKEALKTWLEASSATLPETATVTTGSGGVHYYYRSNEPTKCKNGIMASVDIKGEGGYIVAPPSIHPSGNPYQWMHGLSLAEVPITEANNTVLELASLSSIKGRKLDVRKTKNSVGEGSRNTTLASHLGSLRNKGWGLDALEAEAIRFNHANLSPALSEFEALGVAQSIYSYPVHHEAVAAQITFVDEPLLAKLTILRPEDESRYRNTEQGWGYLFADVFKDEARFCPERKTWFTYDGTRWKHDRSSLAAGELTKRLADALHVYLLQIPENVRAQFGEGWKKWQRRNTRDIILKDAAGVYPVTLADFDADPYLLNVLNGTLNLKTGELQPHRASDLITRLAPVTYDPQVTFPRWIGFIDEVMQGKQDTIKCLQQCFGYALAGSTNLEKMFILYGAKSRNGKSTLAEAVLGTLGEYGATADPEMLSTNRKTGGGMKATEDLARLDGTRFVSVSEPPKSMNLDSAKLKQWTGSDSIKARYLHENSFEYKPQFKLFLNTNDLPVASDTALFKSRRMVLIPFERHFTEAEQDTTLKQQFSTNVAKSAILNWLLEGWQSLQSEGLTMPSSVAAAVDEYRAESDAIRRFVDERLEVDAEGEIKTTVLLNSFQEWARANGLEPLNSNSFKGELERAGLPVKRRRPKTGGNPAQLLVGYKFSECGGGLLSL